MRKQLWRLWLKLKFHGWQRRRFNRLVIEHVAGKPFVILPEVFNPTLFYSSEFLVTTLNEQVIPPGSAVLDMGTGSGIGAIFAAQRASRVVAVDINPSAVRCARINCLLNGVEETVTVLEGDLFEPVAGERFDVVLFNPPYYRGAPHNTLDRAFHAVDVVERFAAGLAGHLAPGGSGLLILSSAGDEQSFLELFRTHDFHVSRVAERVEQLETLTVYCLLPAPAAAPV